MNGKQNRRASYWLALGLLVLLALGARLPGLGDQTISHTEFFTPGIEFPDYVGTPRPRVDLLDVFRSVSLSSDIHPPGFHLVVWNWTKLFGTGQFAMRLPSVLIATATVVMLYLLGLRTTVPWVAFGAAGMLALHALHIDKSVQSGIWIWPAFYALASILLMLAFLDRPSLRRWLGYVVVLAMGLWTEYTFWVFAASQTAILGLQAAWRPRVRALIEGQALAVLLALPVLIHLRTDLLYGARAYLKSDQLDFILYALRFGGLIDARLASQLVGGGVASGALLMGTALVGGLLLLLGLRSDFRMSAADEPAAWSVPGYVAPLIAAVATAMVLFYAWLLPLGWKVPAVLVVFAWAAALSLRPVLDRVWLFCSGPAKRLQRSPAIVRFIEDPVASLALLTVAGYLIIGSITNILAPRLLLIVVPLLLLVMMRGLARLSAFTPKAVPATIGVALLALSVASAISERGRPHSAREYQAVARGLETRAAAGDLIVACNAWYTAPLHYYLTPDRFDFIRAVDLPRRLSPAVNRVWLIVYGETPGPEFAAFEKLLTGFKRFDVFTAREVTVRGYRRATPDGAPAPGGSASDWPSIWATACPNSRGQPGSPTKAE